MLLNDFLLFFCKCVIVHIYIWDIMLRISYSMQYLELGSCMHLLELLRQLLHDQLQFKVWQIEWRSYLVCFVLIEPPTGHQ